MESPAEIHSVNISKIHQKGDLGPLFDSKFVLCALLFVLLKIAWRFLWFVRIHHQSLLSIRNFPSHVEH
jgi:NADH:ubiquinone oxidoreductase subunit 3 (subunit A)